MRLTRAIHVGAYRQRIVIMRYQAIAFALALVLIGASATAVGQIYKWTDEEGNVHFGDKPVGEDTERVAIQSRRTNSERVESQVQARAAAAAKTAEEEAAAAPAGPTEEELQARLEERAKKCDTYRERLQRFVQSRRIYREDEKGERVYMSEEEMQEAREKVENQVQDYCTS
jgi:flagellar biosynthesis GTPase FlhF